MASESSIERHRAGVEQLVLQAATRLLNESPEGSTATAADVASTTGFDPGAVHQILSRLAEAGAIRISGTANRDLEVIEVLPAR